VRLFVQQFLYPAIESSSTAAQFLDQCAFRPSGSPTAAIISILQTVTHLLTDNPYVIVISLDFSKAFDTARESTLLDKMAQLDMPDEVYNWLVNFFSSHMHCIYVLPRRSFQYACNYSRHHPGFQHWAGILYHQYRRLTCHHSRQSDAQICR